MLWIAFELLSLTYKAQPLMTMPLKLVCCELLSNYYLWHIKHSLNALSYSSLLLWIAFELLSLTYKAQQGYQNHFLLVRCELLSNYYLWHIKHSSPVRGIITSWLWIAFELLSLTYKAQRIFGIPAIYNRCELLSNYYLWHIKHSIWH